MIGVLLMIVHPNGDCLPLGIAVQTLNDILHMFADGCFCYMKSVGDFVVGQVFFGAQVHDGFLCDGEGRLERRPVFELYMGDERGFETVHGLPSDDARNALGELFAAAFVNKSLRSRFDGTVSVSVEAETGHGQNGRAIVDEAYTFADVWSLQALERHVEQYDVVLVSVRSAQ